MNTLPNQLTMNTTNTRDSQLESIMVQSTAFHVFVILMPKIHFIMILQNTVKKVKQSRYTPWRRLGGEEV
jgi:predicted membrane channel-forming protein YqfA (hemolysin III family)